MTDESIMPIGKYKGEKLANIPAHYLLLKGTARLVSVKNVKRHTIILIPVWLKF